LAGFAAGLGVVAAVVHVHAHPVAGAVHVELAVSAACQHVVHRAVFLFIQQTNVQHALRQHAGGGVMRVGESFAWPAHFDGGFLCS